MSSTARPVRAAARAKARAAPRRRARAPKEKPAPLPLPPNPRTNEEVALAFDEIGDLLEINGANPFRVRAYRTAAQRVREQERALGDRISAGDDLAELPGIGKDLALKIDELVRTGTTQVLDEARKLVPRGLRELMKLPALGPKRVRALHDALGIGDVDELRRAIDAGRLTGLRGFGAATATRLKEALAAHAGEAGPARVRIDAATSFADDLVRWMKGARGVRRVVVAGSFRRAKETVGDLDILATGDDAAALVRRFVAYHDAAAVSAEGETRAVIRLSSGLQVDLRVVADESYGAALHYFTGSKAHNIAVRRLGQRRGLKINEYGVFRGEQRIAGATEEEVYRAVDLPFIPPELREDNGEIDAARAGTLPDLVTLADLRGDLHAHTMRTDGTATIEEMVEAARPRGLSYLAVTEHSQRIAMSHGLDPEALRTHARLIERANAKLRGFRLLTGIEVDILEDGSLDLPEDALLGVDVVVASIHSAFDRAAEKQTERILRALDHASVGILGHPSGRLLGARKAMDFDVDRVIAHAAERGVVLELNAQPERLDLDELHCRAARKRGVLVAVDSDAHSTAGLADLRFGVGQARRGWLEKKDVLNTRPVDEVLRLLHSRRSS